MATKTSRITVSLPEPAAKAVEEASRRERKSRSAVVSEAVQKYVADVRRRELDQQIEEGFAAMTPEEIRTQEQIAEEGIAASNEALRSAIGDQEEEPWW